MSPLVVQTSFIGDVVLTTPLLARLAASGRGPVDVVATPVGAALLGTHPAVRRLIVYDKRGGGISAFVSAARAASGHAEAFLAQGSLRSAALAVAAGCRERTGFDTSAGRALYTRRVEYRDDWHHARRLVSLAEHEAGELDGGELRPTLYPSSADVVAVDALMQGRERPVVALAPGSVWATKRWPYFDRLASLLAAEFDIALVGSSADRGIASDVARGVPDRCVVDATGRLSLLGSAELIRRACVLVSNDSAPQHLAAAMGTPTVTIFGPTVPAFGFGPLAPRSTTAGLDSLACRPCDRHGPRRCPLGHWRCMREITPGAVAALVRTTITGGDAA